MNQRSSFFRTVLGGFVILTCIFLVTCAGHRHGIFQLRQMAYMQQAHAIGLAMYMYANDNHGNYPAGRSSTEVFQQLRDGGYIVDSACFYVPMPGKSKPLAGQKLEPENVCWDVTGEATLHSPESLPLVFLTGYRVTYSPGAPAIPVIKPYPAYQNTARTWVHWWHGEPEPPAVSPGIIVSRVNNIVMFTHFSAELNPDGGVPEFIPSDFKPDGKIYRQLTPDGPLP